MSCLWRVLKPFSLYTLQIEERIFSFELNTIIFRLISFGKAVYSLNPFITKNIGKRPLAGVSGNSWGIISVGDPKVMGNPFYSPKLTYKYWGFATLWPRGGNVFFDLFALQFIPPYLVTLILLHLLTISVSDLLLYNLSLVVICFCQT